MDGLRAAGADMNEEEQLAALCRNWGAQPPQDRLMARKLLERAKQLSEERGMDRVAALRYLLELVRKGQQEGDGPDPDNKA